MSTKKKKQQGIEINVGVCEKTFKKLTVTQRHINEGKKGDAESCPIALAVREALGPEGKDADVQVSGDDASFTIERKVSVPVVVCGTHVDDIVKKVTVEGNLHLGSKADEFVRAFDVNGVDGVKPMTFTGKPVLDVQVVDY